ncbi:aldo/keto reductase [Desemzia sp. RIT804]|uniref:aldo/keto reductase family protein n=1 Tax=Desemzia sp. RIT 804 TaxID=2810209 RepID=UPI001951728E|nr:aldo/keto reductase [Desemzia sp. RIT 804]MBM6615724.1 aldo/keto reductase [Desemzia sp. RIT 804]
METITLANGLEMPLVGTGTNTYGKEGNQYNGELNEDFSALENAIQAGYRLIDTAISYRNEAGVGKTIADSGIPRDDFFITTKIPADDTYIGTKEAVEQTITNSLENLETDYIDLYLIHHPIEDEAKLKHTWEVLESFVDNGKIKSIGVSNFDIDLLKTVQQFARIQPTVNQIQSNPHTWNNEVIEYMQQHDIVAEAWGPLSRVTDEQIAKLDKIAENYGKNWAQVLLRYQIQRGVVVIPKSHNNERQSSNLELFDFELSDEHVILIESL